MAIIYEKNFIDPNEKVVRQFTNCCGASDKGTEWGVVCRGCYSPIEGYMADGDDAPEEFENLINSEVVLKRFREKKISICGFRCFLKRTHSIDSSANARKHITNTSYRGCYTRSSE